MELVNQVGRKHCNAVITVDNATFMNNEWVAKV